MSRLADIDLVADTVGVLHSTLKGMPTRTSLGRVDLTIQQKRQIVPNRKQQQRYEKNHVSNFKSSDGPRYYIVGAIVSANHFFWEIIRHCNQNETKSITTSVNKNLIYVPSFRDQPQLHIPPTLCLSIRM
jgi:hypothetical protein